MKLLVITQKIDKADSVLGFFHSWVAHLAEQHDQLTVICLYEGEHDLPANVSVFSLGKEKTLIHDSPASPSEAGRARFMILKKLMYVWRFYKYIFKFFHDYDSILVHMNQEYILLAGWLWKALGKKIYLWRNHYSGSFLTDVAAAFCTNVFCTSKHSYTASYDRTIIMPVGIDTTVFTESADVERTPNSILFLGRISPSKRPHVLLEALKELRDKNVSFTASFYGEPGEEDGLYFGRLIEFVQRHGLQDTVTFHGGVAHEETPEVYQSHDVFVNLSRSGMYDKTIFEALACGTLSVATSGDYRQIADEKLVFDGTREDLTVKLESILSLSAEEKDTLRAVGRSLVEEHTLTRLISKLTGVLGSRNVQ